ncbi:hypothetical protein AB1303_01310 [Saccharolobus solfataricus]|uniref:Uncharacterized protein n=1 Tax=Saccharolobus solfataricus TaxID=2287 RepID=A0A7S9IH12_SACSO|nr:hypothetical protein [Saccharolobus solfataricus]QPG48968.1 hypothetical protein HFC64_02655 [Saccharolobus solfataricus]
MPTEMSVDSWLDLGFQELLDGLLFAVYLARASITAGYSVGRDQIDESS